MPFPLKKENVSYFCDTTQHVKTGFKCKIYAWVGDDIQAHFKALKREYWNWDYGEGTHLQQNNDGPDTKF